MANLETLELTINANAESASQGLSSLINSLSALQQAVGKNVGGLQKLNSELSKLKSFKGMKLPSATGASQSVKSTANKVAQSTQDWASTHRLVGDAIGRTRHLNAEGRYDWTGAKFKQWNFKGKDANGNQLGAFEAVKNPQWYYPVGKAPVAKELQQMDEAIKRTNGELPKLKGRASEVIQPLKEMGEEAQKTGKKTTDGFSKIGRIASTMLIRTALRGVIKAFGEAWNSVYNFSKAMGGEFAQSIDKIRGLLKGAAINLTSAFAPAIAAILPIVNAVAAAINYLAAAIQWLFSLLGLGSGLFGATAEQIDKFSGSAGGGSKAAKEMLASFDELNVISQESGGGGGGGGGGAGALSGMIGEEMDAITVMAGEAMLALGLILAFTGHPLIGGALIAIGAAGIAGPIVTKWGDLSGRIKGEIVNIMAIAGASMLGIGMILALTGANVPLGIGLIIAGIGNLAGAVTLTFGLDDLVKQQIADITFAVSGGLLAVGAILAFLSPAKGLGIGLMIAGAVALGSAVALEWGLDVTIEEILSNLTSIIGGALFALGAVIAFSGASLPIGIGLMLAGAATLATAASLEWGLSDQIKNVVVEIEGVLGTAMLAIGAILAFSNANLPLGIGLMAAGAISLASATVISWGLSAEIQQTVAQIESILGGALLVIGAILAFSGANLPLGIGLMIAGGLALGAAVATDWASIVENIKSVAASIQQMLVEAWEAVKEAVASAWESVCNWFDETIVQNVTKVWNQVSGFVSGVWEGIKTGVSNAWEQVVNWWNNGIGGWISSAWATVAGVFEIAFAPIAVALGWLADLFGYDGKSIRIGINIGVNGIYDGTDAADIADKVMNSTKNGNKYNVRDLYNGLFKASGGLVPSGDLFIANEQGAELVGSIGSHTAVANNDQIIEGISRGVADGQAEQNALLRQQNDLLRDILRKDNSVRVGASAALGRTVRQSLDMYSSMVGG